MKNKNNASKNNKPFIKTKQRLDGGKEVEITTSPSKTTFGKIVAVAIAAFTVLGSVVGLIYLLTQL